MLTQKEANSYLAEFELGRPNISFKLFFVSNKELSPITLLWELLIFYEVDVWFRFFKGRPDFSNPYFEFNWAPLSNMIAELSGLLMLAV